MCEWRRWPQLIPEKRCSGLRISWGSYEGADSSSVVGWGLRPGTSLGLPGEGGTDAAGPRSSFSSRALGTRPALMFCVYGPGETCPKAVKIPEAGYGE